MTTTRTFNIKFGRIARTLVCEDAMGTIVFTFETGPAESQFKQKSKLYLGAGALIQVGDTLQHASPADADRVAIALEETRRYAESCGYWVEVR
jgi:hypothetical protein